jgi:hypothetical protein
MLRARNNPELNINNPDNITRLIKVITMYQYKDIRDTGKLYTKAKLQYLKDNFQFEFGYVFLIISLTGLIYLYKTEKQKFYYLTSILILFLLSVFVFYKQMSYTNVYDTIYVFYLPVYLILTISFCYGLKFLYYFFTKFSNTYFYIISLVLIIIISANFINNFQYNNFNKIDLLEQHYKDIITEINKTKVSNNQSYIFTREETMTYVSWYYRIVENKYRNYKFIFPELLEFDWYKNLYNINEQDILKLKNKSIDNLYKYKFKIYKKTNNWYRIGLLHKYNIGNIQIEYGSYNTDKNLDLYKTNLHIEIKKILDLYSNVYLYKGIVLMKNKNYEKAYNFFIKSIKYNENNKQTQYNLEVIKNIIKN